MIDTNSVLDSFVAATREQVHTLVDPLALHDEVLLDDQTEACGVPEHWPRRYAYGLHGKTIDGQDARPLTAAAAQLLAEAGWTVRDETRGARDANRYVAQREGYVYEMGGTERGNIGLTLSSPCVSANGDVDHRELT